MKRNERRDMNTESKLFICNDDDNELSETIIIHSKGSERNHLTGLGE